MRDIDKLLLKLTSNYKENIIVFIYLFNLFGSLVIIIVKYNSFQFNDSKKIEITININLKSI